MERDRLLQQLFDLAKHDLGGEAFVAGVMAQIDALVLLAAAWLLTPTMVAAVTLLSQALPQSLVEVDEPSAFVGRLLSPLNSIAAVVAVTILALVYGFRKLF